MAQWKGRSKQKESGGKYWPSRKKRARELGADPIYTKTSDKTKSKMKRKRSGSMYNSLITASHANLNLGDNKFKKSKIQKVIENAANRHFVRMNVINKGALVQTENGLARVTSKPTRDGIVNAVLVKK